MSKNTEEWNKMKPQRPKRPTGAFIRFISEFKTFTATEAKGKILFKDAAEAWNALSEMEKALYADQDELEAYRENLAVYNKKMEAMKGPPTAYALYVRYYWRTYDLACKDGDRKEFGKIQQRIANDWKNLDETELKVYKASADLLKALFEREKAAVLAKKRPFDLEWQDEGLKNLEAALFKEKRQKQVDKEDKEKDQQEKDQYEENGQQEKKDDDKSMDTDDEDDDEYKEKIDYSMVED